MHNPSDHTLLWYLKEDTVFPTIYHYDGETGEYYSQGQSDPSPLEPGVFVDPAHSTRIAPPECDDNQKPAWNGKKWTLVADYRGEEWFDDKGESVTIKDLGDPIQQGLLAERPFIPEPQPTIDELLAYAADLRWQKETGGLNLDGTTIATDRDSQSLIQGARIAADTDATFTTEWKTQDGFKTLDTAQIKTISNAVLAHIAACFQQEAQIAVKIKQGAITTKAQIDEAFGDRS